MNLLFLKTASVIYLKKKKKKMVYVLSFSLKEFITLQEFKFK